MNLLYYTSFVSCSIVADDFSLQHAVGTVGQAWLSKTFNVLDTLSYRVPIIGLAMVGPEEESFQNKYSRVPEQRYFLDTVFHKRAILLIF